jgi:RNA polymerase sigma-70 factor (ECF subfamily)
LEEDHRVTAIPEKNNPERLLQEARRGDGEHLGDLLQLYRNYLYMLARTQIDLHLQGRLNPSDLVQETFLLACRHFRRFRGENERELVAWLRRILVRTLARQVEKQIIAKKRTIRREISLDKHVSAFSRSTNQITAALAASGSSPSVHAQRRELAATVADQLARLPSAYRDVLILRNLEGHAFEEVARRMGRTPGAVRILWLRALDRFRQLNERPAT